MTIFYSKLLIFNVYSLDLEANRQLTEEITEYCKSLNCSSYNGDSLPILDEMVLAKCDGNYILLFVFVLILNIWFHWSQ